MPPIGLFLAEALKTKFNWPQEKMNLAKRFVEAMDIVEMIEIRLIQPSSNQIRNDIQNIEELMFSIKSNGLLQPILIRPLSSGFEVVCGNRRLEACRKLHWLVIPAIVSEVTDKEAFELSLVENVQRNSLSILEEARAYRKYTKEFGWGGVQELGQKIGKSPAYVSHVISLLKLPPKIQEKLESNEISRSVAQELLWVRDEELQLELADLSTRSCLTVNQIRQTTKLIYHSVEVKADKDNYDIDAFANNRIRNSAMEGQRILSKAALGLRIAMIRVDSLIEKTNDQDVKNFLIQKRYLLHEIIDEILARRKLAARA